MTQKEALTIYRLMCIIILRVGGAFSPLTVSVLVALVPITSITQKPPAVNSRRFFLCQQAADGKAFLTFRKIGKLEAKSGNRRKNRKKLFPDEREQKQRNLGLKRTGGESGNKEHIGGRVVVRPRVAAGLD